MCLAACGNTASALDFSFSFVNSGHWANAGSPTDVVQGRILGLNEGNNWQVVTVWVDSVVPSLDPDFASPGLPHSFTSNIDAVVTGGVLISANFSATDGNYSIRLNGAYFSLANFTQAYIYDGNVTFAALGSGDPAPVPDSGAATCLLLGAGLVAVGALRNRVVR